MENILPVITLYQPWATWIMRGWKTIETRTHHHFNCLKGKQILIHAGQRTDLNARNNPYLSEEQLTLKPHEIINGFILGSVFVSDFRLLTPDDAERALVECDTRRYGLFIENVEQWMEPIPEKGQIGIWYYNLSRMIKCKKIKDEI